MTHSEILPWTHDEILAWAPESEALFDVHAHPLWQRALGAVSSGSAGDDVRSFIIGGADADVQLCHSCIVVVTDRGRVLYQNRREGKQGFGGGKYCMGAVAAAYRARRELFMESNIDLYSNPGFVRLSRPVLVTQCCDGWRGQSWSTCWVQIALFHDDAICYKYGGMVLQVGAVELWSREVAQAPLERESSADTISYGQVYWGRPVFGITLLEDAYADRSGWRTSDWTTMGWLKSFVAMVIAGCDNMGMLTAVSDSEVPEDYRRRAFELALSWRQGMGDIAEVRWPLLASPVYCVTLRDWSWRAAQATTALNAQATRTAQAMWTSTRGAGADRTSER